MCSSRAIEHAVLHGCERGMDMGNGFLCMLGRCSRTITVNIRSKAQKASRSKRSGYTKYFGQCLSVQGEKGILFGTGSFLSESLPAILLLRRSSRSSPSPVTLRVIIWDTMKGRAFRSRYVPVTD